MISSEKATRKIPRFSWINWMCSIRSLFSRSKIFSRFLGHRLDVPEEPFPNEVKYGINDLVLVFEMPVDGRGHQADVAGDAGDGQPL